MATLEGFEDNEFTANDILVACILQDYSLSMYFRQSWRDPRLVFAPINNRTSTIRLHDGSWNTFWVPDTFFRNEKKAAFHTVTVSNRMLKLNSTGHMWYVIR
jgi:hypothetical protein